MSAVDYGILLLLSGIRATTPLVLSELNHEISPILSVIFRSGGVCLGTLLVNRYYKHSGAIQFTHSFIMMCCQAFGSFLSMSIALLIISPTLGSAIFSLIPQMTIIGKILIKKRTFVWAECFWLLLGFIGVILILVFDIISDRGTDHIWVGVVIYLSGVILYTIGGIYWEQVGEKEHWTMISFGSNLFSLFVCLYIWILIVPGLSLFSESFNNPSIQSLEILWMMIFSGFGSSGSFYFLLSRQEIRWINQAWYLVPLITLYEEAIILKIWSGLTWYKILLPNIGVLLIIISLYNINKQIKMEEKDFNSDDHDIDIPYMMSNDKG